MSNCGVLENEYHSEEEIFYLIHEMRKRVMTSHILGTILFERTMLSQIEGQYTADYLWHQKQIVSFLKVDKGLAEKQTGVQLMKAIPHLEE